MMHMLDTGGIPALTDGHRTADRHNPHGYFEDDRVKRLAQDSSWLDEAQGRAVKVIYRLLPHLPPHLQYRVLFMNRDLNRSQVKAVIKSGLTAAGGNYRKVLELFRLPASDYQRFMDFLRHHDLKP